MQPCSKCGLIEMHPDHSSMTVNLGCPRRACWNSLQNWLASPVHAPWMLEALAMGLPWARASAWHRWTQKDCDESRVWPGSCVCTAALPVLQDPTGPSTDVCSSAPAAYASPHVQVLPPFQTRVPVLAWPHTCNGCLGVPVWVGSSQPLCQRMPRSHSCLDAVGPGAAPWCCWPPFAGRASSDHSSLPPSATWG